MIEIRRGETTLTLDDLGFGLQVVRVARGARVFEFEAAPPFILQTGRVDGPWVLATPTFPGSHPPLVDACEHRVVIDWAIREVNIDALYLVTVLIEIDENEQIDFRISVRNRLLNFALNRVQFPILRVKSIGEPTDNVLVLPWQQGGVLRDPAHRLKVANAVDAFAPDGVNIDFFHPSMMAPVQLFAFYRPSSGDLLYLQTTDGEAYRKDFTFLGVDTSTEIAHHGWPVNDSRPGNDPDAEALYEMPYAFRMAVMEGAWYDAARRYREWALKQIWAQRGPIATAPDFSPRLRDAVISIGHGAAPPGGDVPPLGGPFDLDFYAEEAIGLAELLETSAIVSGWFYWHTNPFDKLWPEWSPRSSFEPALRTAQGAGIAVVPYAFIPMWDVASKFYSDHDGASRALRDPFGRIVLIPFFGLKFIGVNFADAQNRDVVLRQWMPIVTRLGTDGLYLDAWSGGGLPRNHDPLIRRAGGTNAIGLGNRAMTQQFKEAMKGWNGKAFETPDRMIVSEFVDELLLDSVELASSTPFGFTPFVDFRPLPVYSTVYHDYQISNELLYPEDVKNEALLAGFLAQMALTFHAGRLLTLATFGRAFDGSKPVPLVKQTPFRKFWDFIKLMVRRHGATARYQRLGERLRPLPGSLDALLDRVDALPDPTVQSSVWRSGGDIGILLTNTGATTRSFQIEMTSPAFPIAGRLGLVEIPEVGRPKLLGVFDGAIAYDAELPPLSLTLIEVLPEAEAIKKTRKPRRKLGPIVLVLDEEATSVEAFTPIYIVRRSGPWTFETVVLRLENQAKLMLTVQTGNDGSNWATLGSHTMTAPGASFLTQSLIGGAFVRLRYRFEHGQVIETTSTTFYPVIPDELEEAE